MRTIDYFLLQKDENIKTLGLHMEDATWAGNFTLHLEQGGGRIVLWGFI